MDEIWQYNWKEYTAIWFTKIVFYVADLYFFYLIEICCLWLALFFLLTFKIEIMQFIFFLKKYINVLLMNSTHAASVSCECKNGDFFCANWFLWFEQNLTLIPPTPIKLILLYSPSLEIGLFCESQSNSKDLF